MKLTFTTHQPSLNTQQHKAHLLTISAYTISSQKPFSTRPQDNQNSHPPLSPPNKQPHNLTPPHPQTPPTMTFYTLLQLHLTARRETLTALLVSQALAGKMTRVLFSRSAEGYLVDRGFRFVILLSNLQSRVHRMWENADVAGTLVRRSLRARWALRFGCCGIRRGLGSLMGWICAFLTACFLLLGDMGGLKYGESG